MVCNGFKGGTGTSSRRLDASDGGYTVGVLVQCNYGGSNGLRVAGIPVAREMKLQKPCVEKKLDPPVLMWDGNPAPVCEANDCPHRGRGTRARDGFHHRDRRHRCSADPGPVEAARPPRLGRIGPRGRDRGRRVRRHLPGVLHRQSWSRRRQQRRATVHPAECEDRARAKLEDGPDVHRGRSGDGRVGYQCPGGGENDGRRRLLGCPGDTARSVAGGSCASTGC